MQTEEFLSIIVQRLQVPSQFLEREVIVDVFLPKKELPFASPHLLFINDGQDLETMNFSALFEEATASGVLQPLLCVGIHANENRRVEYGTASQLDFGGRGAKAGAYNRFVLEELMPLIQQTYSIETFQSRSVAGFSLGGLSALDMVWNHPQLFSVAGVFSGSLWWRSKDLKKGYDEDKHRIMHGQVRNGKYYAGLRFYFTTGSLDETADRNNNGIIDSIDDTLALIEELTKKGYTDKDIVYKNFEDGKHDVATWGRAMPDFLLWGWGVHNQPQMLPESC